MKPKFVTISIVVVMLLLVGNVAAISLGAGPGDMIFRNMPKGGYTKKMMMVNNLEDYDLSITITPDKKFKDWITFEPSANFTLPAHSRHDLWAVVQLPDDIANGNYTGEIIVHAAPTAKVKKVGEGLGAGLVVGASVSLATTIEVTGVEVVSYTIKRLRAESNEIGYPILFYVTVVNTGNVRVTPNIHIDVFDQNKTTILKSDEFAEVEVLPGLQEEISISLSSDELGVGEYWANVSGYLGGKVVGLERVSFSVLEEGTFTIEGKLDYVIVEKDVEINEIAKIIALFKNVGQLPVSAKFEGEVYLNEKLVGTLETEKIKVDAGKSVNFTTYFTPTEPGTYDIRGHVLYSEKTTDKKETLLHVERRVNYLPYIVILLVVVSAIVILSRYLKKRR